MKKYTITVFSETGEKLLDDTFAAVDDDDAKRLGEARLSEKGYENYTHRCVSADATLLLFHR